MVICITNRCLLSNYLSYREIAAFNVKPLLKKSQVQTNQQGKLLTNLSHIKGNE